MSASTARHETRALLRAHLAAAYGYGHLTRHCPVCHRLLRLAMEPGEGGEGGEGTRKPGSAAPEPPYEPQEPRSRSGGPTTAESAAVPPESTSVPPERYEDGREDANEARAGDADGAERPSTP
ncbi:DUF6274 family protein [Streptomyces sp. CA-146814]|uniref:DUF6274 family protein n=1 Tax=Streptomyces sp. CA-146814 TaxID=3240053 RepID=UPI003D94078C